MENKEEKKEDPKKQMDEFRMKLFSERTKAKPKRKVNPEARAIGENIIKMVYLIVLLWIVKWLIKGKWK